MDDQGKRWDVLEALNSSSAHDGVRPRKRNTEVILERWRIELKQGHGERTYDFGTSLPTIYKKCIVFFRSLYSTAKFVPAWKFVKGLPKSGSANSLLRLNCRIVPGDVQQPRFDALAHPLYESRNAITTDYSLGITETPAGQFSAEVSYRNDCNFRVDDSEALLSSRFMGADEQYFQPSLGTKNDDRRFSSRTVEVGSLPAHRQSAHDREPIQAYGSLSTFHGDVPPRGTSPISALRAQKAVGSDADTDASDSLPQSRPMQTSRASLRSLEGGLMARRPSVSFQPFKAGSLSSSPGRGSIYQHGDMPPPQSPQSLPRASGISALTQARNRSSLTAGMPATLRGGPVVAPDYTATSSASSSPKPAPVSRYSSSFTHRRGRSSFGGGASKVIDDDQGSSGKQSLSSSVQPGSGILAEGGASSGSLQTDDDNISEFLKLLDSKKTLQSFEPSGDASRKRTSAQLSKFQSMREPNNVLIESMTSSALLHRSSSSSSRHLMNLPTMIGATSMSTSSSPGKPISPHTPHTPAVPSRLSANSVAEYNPPRRISERSRANPGPRAEDLTDDEPSNDRGIDIPTSPRTYFPHVRRSSSVAQQHRNLPVEDDLGDLPFGIHRSISLGADDREPPSLEDLLGLGIGTDNIVPASSLSPSNLLRPAPEISEPSRNKSRQSPSVLDGNDSEAAQLPRGTSAGSINAPYRPRIGRSGGRGIISPQTGSYSSQASGSGMSERASGRHSLNRATGAYDADDEPLLFDMSEIGREQSRRSLEESRGGGSIDRGGDSSSSSRRGSRRGY